MAYGIDAHRLWLPPCFDEPNRLFESTMESDLQEERSRPSRARGLKQGERHEKETNLAQESPDDFRVDSAP